jgi:hypothetical protein
MLFRHNNDNDTTVPSINTTSSTTTNTLLSEVVKSHNQLSIEIAALKFFQNILICLIPLVRETLILIPKPAVVTTLFKKLGELKTTIITLSELDKQCVLVIDKCSNTKQVKPLEIFQQQDVLKEIQKKLDSAIHNSYIYRSSIISEYILPLTHLPFYKAKIHTLVSNNQADALMQLVFDADFAIDRLAITINKEDNPIPQNTFKLAFEAYIAKLNNFSLDSYNIVAKLPLHSFWQEYFPQTYAIQLEIYYLMSWYTNLNQAITSIAAQYKPRSFYYQLAIQLLLTKTKRVYTLELSKQPNTKIQLHTMMLLYVLKQQLDESSTQTTALAKLKTKRAKLAKEITNIEQSLSQQTAWPAKIIAESISFLTGISHFVTANAIVHLINNTVSKPYKMGPTCSKITTTICVTLLAGIDYIFMGYLGISFALISPLNQYFLNNVPPIINFGARLRINEENTLSLLHATKSTVSFNIYLTTQGLLSRMSKKMLGLLALTYFSSCNLSNFAKYCSNKLAPSESPKKDFYELFVTTPLMIAVKIGSFKVTNYYGIRFFEIEPTTKPLPSAEDMLRNYAICRANKAKCHETALHELGFTKEATPKEIAASFRKFARQFHPDSYLSHHTKNSSRFFEQKVAARNILIDFLNQEKIVTDNLSTLALPAPTPSTH